MLIDKIEFTEDFRLYKKGDTFTLTDRVTVITGDNGSGKSTLVGCIRAHFETAWSRSQVISSFDKSPVAITPKVPRDTKMAYIDLAKDHLQVRSDFDFDNLDLQMSLMSKSSGQATAQQTLSIARSATAPIQIIDEPERGLSVAKQIVVGHGLKEIIASKPDVQFIVITHSREVMSALCEEVLVTPSGSRLHPEDYYGQMAINGLGQASKYIEAIQADLADAAKEADR